MITINHAGISISTIRRDYLFLPVTYILPLRKISNEQLLHEIMLFTKVLLTSQMNKPMAVHTIPPA